MRLQMGSLSAFKWKNMGAGLNKNPIGNGILLS
ncbi:hypothetical protein SDC9_143306 [bioreactor metagenome]|uniref:Uncharacterized protein n=1 Tax=bioreactor metagenome TaxID=1076179 RepID=A0A645E3M9_9ZZZZ